MSIVTFYNSSREQTGKTMSIAAIATYMAIEHNYRILVISTTNTEDAFARCFWEDKKKKRLYSKNVDGKRRTIISFFCSWGGTNCWSNVPRGTQKVLKKVRT